jgi:hypothetical protein
MEEMDVELAVVRWVRVSLERNRRSARRIVTGTNPSTGQLIDTHEM